MQCIEYRSDFKTAWTDFVEHSSAASLGHDITWNNVFRNGLGHRTNYLIALDNREITGILPLIDLRHRLLGARLVSVPILDRAGVLAANEQARKLLIQSLDGMIERGTYKYAQIRSSWDGRNGERNGKATMLLKLSSDADSIWQSLDAKVRNQVRKAEKSGLTAEVGSASLVTPFYQIYSRNMRDLGVPALPIRLFSEAINQFGDRAKVVLVRKSSEPVGGGIVIFFKDTASVPWASSSRKYFQMCPNNLLYWTIIQLACARGCSVFDFGRSTIGTGPFHFKKQWGAEAIPLSWDYHMSCSTSKPDFSTGNPRYKLLIRVWRHLPVSLANVVGPMISGQVA